MKTPFYVTTPIYYPTAAPHIGSTYTTTIADTFCRFERAKGREAFMLTGTDEHGEKMVESAAAQGMEPKRFADQMAERFQSGIVSALRRRRKRVGGVGIVLAERCRQHSRSSVFGRTLLA